MAFSINSNNDNVGRGKPDTIDLSMMSLQQVRTIVADAAHRAREQEEQLPGFFTEDFGPWRFDPDDLLLIHKQGSYVIPLERITSSSCITDWIFQVQRKGWCDPITMYTLLVAFRCILNPQRNYCSFEEDMRASGKELAQVYADKVLQHREETLQIQKFQREAETILEMLTSKKPMPLSLLLESVSISREDVLATLVVLEKIRAIRFDRENRYIYLLTQLTKKEEEGEGYGETLS